MQNLNFGISNGGQVELQVKIEIHHTEMLFTTPTHRARLTSMQPKYRSIDTLLRHTDQHFSMG
jgi:hypothetical protein